METSHERPATLISPSNQLICSLVPPKHLHPNPPTRTTHHSDCQISETAIAQRAVARLEPIYHTHAPSTDSVPCHKHAPWPYSIQMAHRSCFIAVFVMSSGTWRWAYLLLVWMRRPRPLSNRMERAELHAFKMLQGDLGSGECPKPGHLLGHYWLLAFKVHLANRVETWYI